MKCQLQGEDIVSVHQVTPAGSKSPWFCSRIQSSQSSSKQWLHSLHQSCSARTSIWPGKEDISGCDSGWNILLSQGVESWDKSIRPIPHKQMWWREHTCTPAIYHSHPKYRRMREPFEPATTICLMLLPSFRIFCAYWPEWSQERFSPCSTRLLKDSRINHHLQLVKSPLVASGLFP